MPPADAERPWSERLARRIVAGLGRAVGDKEILQRADAQSPEERLAVPAGTFIGATIGSVLVLALAFAAPPGWSGTGTNLALFAIFFVTATLFAMWRTRRVQQGKRSARLSRGEFIFLQTTWLVLMFCVQVGAQSLLYRDRAASDEMFAFNVALTSALVVPAYFALLRKPMPVALPLVAALPTSLAASGLAWFLAHALATHLS